MSVDENIQVQNLGVFAWASPLTEIWRRIPVPPVDTPMIANIRQLISRKRLRQTLHIEHSNV